MEKGKLGVTMSFYATVAFLLVILTSNIIPVFLILGVTLVVEKNEWASRQVIQAIVLQFLSVVVSTVLNLFDGFYRIPKFGTIWSNIVIVVESVVALVVLVLGLIAVLNVSKGMEANVPIASTFANWAYGKTAAKPAYQQPVYQQPVYQQPVAPAPTQAPVADVCANCGTPLNGSAFCTKCGTPAAR